MPPFLFNITGLCLLLPTIDQNSVWLVLSLSGRASFTCTFDIVPALTGADDRFRRQTREKDLRSHDSPAGRARADKGPL